MLWYVKSVRIITWRAELALRTICRHIITRVAGNWSKKIFYAQSWRTIVAYTRTNLSTAVLQKPSGCNDCLDFTSKWTITSCAKTQWGAFINSAAQKSNYNKEQWDRFTIKLAIHITILLYNLLLIYQEPWSVRVCLTGNIQYEWGPWGQGQVPPTRVFQQGEDSGEPHMPGFSPPLGCLCSTVTSQAGGQKEHKSWTSSDHFVEAWEGSSGGVSGGSYPNRWVEEV